MSPAAKRLAGRATIEGTRRYAEKLSTRVAAGHFRELAGVASASTLGLGTYLGPEDGATDVLYQDAVVRALERRCARVCRNGFGHSRCGRSRRNTC